MDNKISVIVLNWNGFTDTIECINSIKKNNYPNFEILIVDNGSEDGSEEKLRKAFPELHLIQTGDNLGYAGGNNEGLRYAFDNGSDYCIILNNDTIVDKDFITELSKFSVKHPQFGIISSKIYFYDRPKTLWFSGAVYSLSTGWSKHIGYNETDRGQYDHVYEIDRACGCAMMVSRNLYIETGGMNEDYFCYAEEVDWSLRAVNKGFKIGFAPLSKVWHKVSVATGGAESGNYIYYALRNNLKCLMDNKPYRHQFFNRFRECIVTMLYIFSLFSLNLPKKNGFNNIFLAVRDYHHGQFGIKK